MEKLRKLVERLLDRSERGLVAWTPSVDDKTFQFSVADSSVVISKKTQSLIEMMVMNNEGSVVDSFSNKDLDQNSNEKDYYFFYAMQKIFDLARRRALRADETVDGLLAALGD